jgi:hypothetical protein
MAMQRWLFRGLRLGWFVLLLVGSAVITAGSAVYWNSELLPPFVVEKLPLAREALYLLALKLHVATAALALPGCLALTSKRVLRRWPRLHRWLGRFVGGVVLLGLLPSGFYLSGFAKGGVWGTLGFVLSGAIVMVAMVQAVRAARASQYLAHRRFTLHVLAQLSVAVTSRALLFGLDAANLDPEVGYLLALWLPVCASAAVVEYLSAAHFPFPWNLRRTHEPLADSRHDSAHVQSGLRRPSHAQA